ncbi:MAG: hypothetical protein P4L50_23740 [Anaerolineaceae bacterium]|nr:hypothetical protein [Anaerolineaceae bacterium]
MNVYRYLPAAENVARILPGMLVELGLDPLIDRFVLTETGNGEAWLFVVMNNRVLEWLDCYTEPKVLYQLSAGLHGHFVFSSAFAGLRYAILLSPVNMVNWKSECLAVHSRQSL